MACAMPWHPQLAEGRQAPGSSRVPETHAPSRLIPRAGTVTIVSCGEESHKRPFRDRVSPSRRERARKRFTLIQWAAIYTHREVTDPTGPG
jgi:hypothetical protein